MNPLRLLWGFFLTVFLAGQGAVAIEMDVNDPKSVKEAASKVASDLIGMYNEQIGKTGIPGKMDTTWWVGGAMFMTLIQYWYITGDGKYNDIVTSGMLHQKGENNNYFPNNWSRWLGNDDQIFWGLAAITAAELNYPEQHGQPSWAALAQGVFNNQAPRWDSTTCDGGMRWQVHTIQEGYNLKNTVSNGGLFQLASRLYFYTNNQTYSDWANKIYDWCSSVPLINEQNWEVGDSTNNEQQCKNLGPAQWTYNYGMFVGGSSYMYNHTNGTEQKWLDRLNGFLGASYTQFFPESDGGILTDPSCEIPNNCDGNSACFKGFLASWMAFMTTLVEGKSSEVMKKIKASAAGAAKQCSGGSTGQTCGTRWYQPTYDNTGGICQQMSSLSVLSSSLIEDKKNAAPKNSDNGGTSQTDPSAGTGGGPAKPPPLKKITAGDRAGAGILTAVFLAGWVGGLVWMIIGG